MATLKGKISKKMPTREASRIFGEGSVDGGQPIGKAKKRVQQESVTVPHAQRPSSTDAADLIGSAVHRPLELRTSVRPSNFDRIVAKLRENAFRTICNLRFFDAENFLSEKFWQFFFGFS